MISKSERLLIFRFLFSKKSDGYVSIFAWFSIIGISLGVAAIIIVMSVMNGFRSEIADKILGYNGHISVVSLEGKVKNYDKLSDNINKAMGSSAEIDRYKHVFGVGQQKSFDIVV